MPTPAKPPPAIGDVPETSYKLIHEEFAAPPDRKALLAAIERIISGGGVQRLVVQYGQPIKVSRRVRADLPGDAIPEELALDEDVMSAVRNAEMESLPFYGDKAPFEALFFAFSALYKKKLIPKAVIVPQVRQLMSWLEVEDLNGLFGVDVFQHKEMPDDTLLLVGAKADEPDVVAFSFRLEMTKKTKKSARKVAP